ncbi:cupin domain-containing protein [Brevibacillus migulae]|uniref:cupin domain-containing protein n=1 Tax=Brevibacillus migulae TaxID=1644114 RepID=UPI00106EE386|nr:cupin domain-containing protein [Brevibacillus migulae]
MHLVEGSLLIILAEQKSYRLEAGDSFAFELDQLHRMENVGDGDCVYFVVIDANS